MFTFAESRNRASQPYKYNGKELDQMHGLKLYDYSARYYESAIGRFTTIDPLAEKYYSISPYVYCANNPLKYIDPTGKDIVIGGADSTSLRLKTDAFDFTFSSETNFGGNHEIADLSNLVIGFEKGMSAEAMMFFGLTAESSMQSVLFLGGDYAGYWYDYTSIGGGIAIQTGVTASINTNKSLFIGINHNKEMNHPIGFQGRYLKGEVAAGAEVGIIGLSGNFSMTTALDNS